MAETQIHAGGSSAAPLTYTVASTEEFTLLAVNATFDGSGAGSAWLPAVEVVSDSGQVVARHITGETVAAGGSAEATFAPFLRSTAAAAASASGYPFAASGINGPYAVASGVTTQFGIDVGALITSDPSIFFEQAHATPGLTGLGIGATGTYAAFWTTQYQDRPATPVANPQNFTAEAEDLSGSMVTILPFLFSIYGRGFVNNSGRAEWDCGWLAVFAVHNGTAAGDPIIISGNQATGQPLDAYTQLLVFQLSTSTFGF